MEKDYMNKAREGLEMVYAVQNFHPYLLDGHLKMFMDHYALK